MNPRRRPERERDDLRSSIDDVIEVYKRDVDRTLLREALAMTPDQRVRKMVELARFTESLREAGRKAFP